MTTIRIHRGIRRELDSLVTQNLITRLQMERIAERYPTQPGNLAALARVFTFLGALGTAAGLVILAMEYINGIRLAEFGLAGATIGLLVLARFLTRSKGLAKTGAALEMCAGLTLQSLIVALGVDFSTGSGNWPLLIGLSCAAQILLAYVLRNRLVLILACVNFFVWFGGQTGYMSGWGAYWMKMNYPVRFLGAGLFTLVIAWIHAMQLKGAHQAFSRVYLHFGLLILHLALWFLSLFGYFEKEIRWSGNEIERILFSLIWAGFALGSLYAAGRLGQRALRSYGLVFLIINIYTFYFQFVVANSVEFWWIHLLLAGGSLLFVGFWLEKKLRGSDPS